MRLQSHLKARGLRGTEHLKWRLSLVELVEMHGEGGEVIGERDPFDRGGMAFVENFCLATSQGGAIEADGLRAVGFIGGDEIELAVVE